MQHRSGIPYHLPAGQWQHILLEGTVSEQQNKQTLERYYQALTHGDSNLMSDVIHEDYVEEMPQSGERISGKRNWMEMMQNYPGMPTASNHSFRVSGDLGYGEVFLKYPNGKTYWSSAIFEFKDGKIAKAREFFAETFEPAQWRSKYTDKRKAA